MKKTDERGINVLEFNFDSNIADHYKIPHGDFDRLHSESNLVFAKREDMCSLEEECEFCRSLALRVTSRGHLHYGFKGFINREV